MTNFFGKSVTAYAPGASGDASPIVNISGGNTQLADPAGVTLDPSGDVWVSNVGD